MPEYPNEPSAIELKGTRNEIYRKINDNKEAEEFFLKTKPNVMMFVVLLNETRIKKLYISEGISRTIPQKVMGSLGKSVQVIVKKCRRGRPQKYDEAKIRKVLSGKASNEEKIVLPACFLQFPLIFRIFLKVIYEVLLMLGLIILLASKESLVIAKKPQPVACCLLV